jgi:soluble lytic murein transglycosylase-like protein
MSIDFSPIRKALLAPVLEKLTKRVAGTLNNETRLCSTSKSVAMLSKGATGQFDTLIEAASKKYDVPSGLIRAVIKAESNYDPTSVSSAGAKGLMQLMDETAKLVGVEDSFDPAQNIDGGVAFLQYVLKRYGNNVELALAAYNAGPGAVDKYDGVPPYQETQIYVKRVIGYWQHEWSA